MEAFNLILSCIVHSWAKFLSIAMGGRHENEGELGNPRFQ